MNKYIKFLYTLGAIVAVVGIWAIASYGKIVSPIFLPTPGEVLVNLYKSFADTSMLVDLWSTMYKFLIAFVIAVILGTPLGILMGSSQKIYYSLEFLVEFFRSIPTTALFPLFILFFGIGDDSKIAVAVWGAGLIIIVNTMYGVHGIKKLRLLVADNLKLNHLQRFRDIIFPDALPAIVSGYRIALSIALVIVVVTEMFIGAQHGLGYRIINAQLVYNTADMFSAILIAGVLGFVSNKLVQFAEEKCIHWKGK